MRSLLVVAALLAALSLHVFASGQEKPKLAVLRATVIDAESRSPIAARVYVQGDDGQWRFARSLAADGGAVEYRVKRNESSHEMHTSVSAHPFAVELPLGRHTITVERGKEYLPLHQAIEVREADLAAGMGLEIPLQRFSDIARQGWYSGETHVHRPLADLPTLLLAEDLNVAFPLTYWVTRSHTPPSQGDRSATAVEPKLVKVDATHVFWPLNTEYEIFTVKGKQHMLGAVFALNHKTVLPMGAPPVRPIAEHARREGALLELDKHNWPWSMVIAAVMPVDLYELANNHMWRTEFLYHDWAERPPEYMGVERRGDGVSERGWIDFTFGNYYALLNAGFRLRPTGGTASGVHPVPLGFGRVYVHCPDGFSYDAWLAGLSAGHSFVTTGPLLVVEVNGQPHGAALAAPDATQRAYHVAGWAKSVRPLTEIELVAAGKVVRRVRPENRPLSGGGYENAIEFEHAADASTWLAVRCWEASSPGRVRFAHTAPVFIDVPGRPLRPAREEIDYLIARAKSQLDRNQGVLDAAELAEYEEALAAFQRIAAGGK